MPAPQNNLIIIKIGRKSLLFFPALHSLLPFLPLTMAACGIKDFWDSIMNGSKELAADRGLLEPDDEMKEAWRKEVMENPSAKYDGHFKK